MVPVEQAQEASTVEDLRKMAHKDNEGNVISRWSSFSVPALDVY